MESRSVAIAVVAALGALALGFAWYSSSQATPCADGEIRGVRCSGDALVYEQCREGRWADASIRCASLSSGDSFFTCDPAAIEVEGVKQAGCINVNVRTEGGTGEAQPVCGDRVCTTAAGAENCASCPIDCGACARGTATPSAQATIPPLSYCGNGVCDASEGCGTCTQDCGCLGAELCGENGVCYPKEACGDGRCTQLERASGTCCQDCGCTSDKFCNEYSGRCARPIQVSNATLNATIQNYTAANPGYAFVDASDTYLGNQAVKQLVFDCNSTVFVCRSILLVASNGTVLREYRTT